VVAGLRAAVRGVGAEGRAPSRGVRGRRAVRLVAGAACRNRTPRGGTGPARTATPRGGTGRPGTRTPPDGEGGTPPRLAPVPRGTDSGCRASTPWHPSVPIAPRGRRC
ncbi:hypothetical protein RSA3_08935, partial [Microbacterium testaceum]